MLYLLCILTSKLILQDHGKHLHSMLFPYSLFSKNRDALIKREWKDELERYITGIVQNQRHKMLAIRTMPDHAHLLIGYNVNQLIPDLVEEIKTSSNTFIKGKRLSKFKFEWQKGYGAFTYSHSQIDLVAKYFLSQEEYFEILEKNNVQFKDEYVFEFFDGIQGWD